jgi:hypothetical protein
MYHSLPLSFGEIIQRTRKLLTEPAVKLRSTPCTRIVAGGGHKQNRDEDLRAKLIHPDFLLHRFVVRQMCYFYCYLCELDYVHIDFVYVKLVENRKVLPLRCASKF